MILIRSRLGFVVASLAVAFICWAVVYLPPYEKIVYENSPVLNKEEADEMFVDALGYVGDESIDRVHSIEDFSDERGFKNVVLEIDTKKMEPTGIYQCINEAYQLGDQEENKIKLFFLKTIKSYGQFFIVTLEDGERIPIFVNDSLVNVRKKGTVKLPIGMKARSSHDFEKYNVHYLFKHGYLDCASGFATGPEMQDFRLMEKLAVIVIVVVMVVFLGIVLGINIGNSRK